MGKIKNWEKICSGTLEAWFCRRLSYHHMMETIQVGYGKWEVYRDLELIATCSNKATARRRAISEMEHINFFTPSLEEGKMTRKRMEAEYVFR